MAKKEKKAPPWLKKGKEKDEMPVKDGKMPSKGKKMVGKKKKPGKK